MKNRDRVWANAEDVVQRSKQGDAQQRQKEAKALEAEVGQGESGAAF